MKTFFTASFILFFQFITFSAEWKYHYKGDYITGISQHGSNVWIGTFAAGIIETDASGSVLNHFTKENSPILTNCIDWLEVDQNGVVWFAMEGVGVGKYDGINWTFFTKLNSPIKPDQYWQLTIDNNNKIWLCSFNYGLFKYDGNNWTVYDTSNSPLSGQERFVKFDSLNNAWIGDAYGIFNFDGTNWTLYDQTTVGFNFGTTRDACFDSVGGLWVACYDGLLHYDGLTWTLDDPTVYGMPSIAIRTVSISNTGSIWMGTNYSGIYKKDGNIWTLYDPVNSTFPDYYCRIISFLPSGDILFASGGGVVSYNGINFSQHFFNNCNIGADLVSTPIVDSLNRKWFGTSGKGLVMLDNFTWSVFDTTNSNIPSNDIGYMEFDKSGNLWYTIFDQFVKYDGTNWTSYNSYSEPIPIFTITDFTIDTNSVIWIADEVNGVYSFDGSSWYLYDSTNSALKDLYFNSIRADRQNFIWLSGYFLGVYYFDGASWNHLTTGNSSIPTDNVVIIHVDSSNNKWFSSDAGLLKFDGVNWTVYDTSNSGIPSIDIGNMCSIGNNYWIQTYDELVNYDGINWTVYNVYNSGISTVFPYGVSADLNGNLWIASTEFNPNQIVNVKETGMDDFKFEVNSLVHKDPIRFHYDEIRNQKSKIEIVNLTGELLKSFDLPKSSTQLVIPSDDFISGIYFAKMTDGNRVGVKKIVVAK